jgi:hypothetical protein
MILPDRSVRITSPPLLEVVTPPLSKVLGAELEVAAAKGPRSSNVWGTKGDDALVSLGCDRGLDSSGTGEGKPLAALGRGRGLDLGTAGAGSDSIDRVDGAVPSFSAIAAMTTGSVSG